MRPVPLLIVDGHNLLFRACFGTPAQIWSRDPGDKRDLTTEFMFFALLRKAVNDELGTWPEILVVFDGEEGSAERREADPGYKANRPVGDEALRPIRALGDVKAAGRGQRRLTAMSETEASVRASPASRAAPSRSDSSARASATVKQGNRLVTTAAIASIPACTAST